MYPAVMQRRDLYVLHLAAAVGMLVLDLEVGKLDTAVDNREIVFERPLP